MHYIYWRVLRAHACMPDRSYCCTKHAADKVILLLEVHACRQHMDLQDEKHALLVCNSERLCSLREKYAHLFFDTSM